MQSHSVDQTEPPAGWSWPFGHMFDTPAFERAIYILSLAIYLGMPFQLLIKAIIQQNCINYKFLRRVSKTLSLCYKELQRQLWSQKGYNQELTRGTQ